MEDVEKMTDNVEYMFVRRMIDALRAGEVEVEEARVWAKDFLVIEPFVSLEDAKVKVAEYVGKHGVFSNLSDYLNSYHEEMKKDEKIANIREHLKSNNIDEALRVAGE